MKKIDVMLEDRFFNKLKFLPYVGVEIEMPIINLGSDHKIAMDIIQGLFKLLLDKKFLLVSKDDDDNIIAVKNKDNGDTISLEYSLNTLEFSLSKEIKIDKLEAKFNRYYKMVQKYLKKYNYKLDDTGINRNYRIINRECLKQKRYKIIEKLLYDSKQELYSQFCAYCCSVQTHINVDKDCLVDVMNVFTMIEDIKSEMFGNSYMAETNLENSRKFLWENSNFGPYNIGKNKFYQVVDEIREDYLKRNLFYVMRDGEYLLLKEKMALNKYFIQDRVTAFDKNGKEIEIIPIEEDFDNFRSYKSVELTSYGTLEIRTDCTQNIENIFKMVAFNVGVSMMAAEILQYIDKNETIETDELIEIAREGLIIRGKGEEHYLGGSMKKVGIWMYENDNGINIKKRLEKKLRDLGYEVICDFDMRNCYLKNGKVYTEEGICLSNVDIFYHMNADEQNSYQNDILRLLEMSGVKVFNNYDAFIKCKDKVIANMILRDNGINVPSSILINNHVSCEFLEKIMEEYGNIIIKPRTNHGGKGILKITDYEQFLDFYVATKNYIDNYYIEQYIEFDDNDYRVEIFNGEVVGTYCRGKCGTYKTNISSGGKMLDKEVSQEYIDIALKCAKVLGITTTIVDMIKGKNDGKIYVLEVNPIMGIFLEEGMKAGTKMPVQEDIPERFKTDQKKIDFIVNYIVQNT